MNHKFQGTTQKQKPKLTIFLSVSSARLWNPVALLRIEIRETNYNEKRKNIDHSFYFSASATKTNIRVVDFTW